MNRKQSGARSPQRFRPQKRQVDDLLNPNVLDDETRQMLLEEVMNPANRPRGGGDGAGVGERFPPGHRHVATGVDGRVQPSASASPSPSKVAGDKDSRFPTQLRSRVQSGSSDLVTAMAARLGELEKSQKHYRSEMEEMRSKYMRLNDAFQKEVKRRDEAEKLVVDLYDEKKELEDEVAAMRRVLESHGLSWSGQPTPRQGKSRGSGASSPAQSESAPFDLYAGHYQEPDQEAGESSPCLSRHSSGPVHFTNTAKKGTQLFSPPSPVKQKVTAARDKPVAPHEGSPVDVALLIKNARILSDYVGWKAIVKVGDRGGGIRDRDVVRVVVYKNGICVNNGAFRPYGWALCDAFIQDLAEGYYPYEFKDKYPDGFPIEVTDRSEEKLDVRGQSPQQGGPGHRLGGGPDDRSAQESKSGGKSVAPSAVQQLREGGYHPLSVDEFLKKIPTQSVTASGKIVQVRNGVAQQMGAKGSTASPVSQGVPLGTVRHVTAAEAQYREAKDTASAVNQDGAAADAKPPSMVVGDLVAILVRLPDGKKVTLNMPRTSTVYEVRKELVAAAPEFARRSYELCQAFPAKTFSDHHMTLAELGITRTCTLMVRVSA